MTAAVRRWLSLRDSSRKALGSTGLKAGTLSAGADAGEWEGEEAWEAAGRGNATTTFSLDGVSDAAAGVAGTAASDMAAADGGSRTSVGGACRICVNAVSRARSRHTPKPR